MTTTVKSMTMRTQSEHEATPASEGRTEILSALIDGELSDDQARQAIKRIGHNDADRAGIVEYIAIGDAMRGLSARHGDFTLRVMAALEKEPVLLAPAPTPKKSERRPALWLAAATAAAITWGLWQSSPRDEAIAPLAAAQQPGMQNVDAMPYLAAHEDFAQAVISAPEMRFSKASLEVRQ